MLSVQLWVPWSNDGECEFQFGSIGTGQIMRVDPFGLLVVPVSFVEFDFEFGNYEHSGSYSKRQ